MDAQWQTTSLPGKALWPAPGPPACCSRRPAQRVAGFVALLLLVAFVHSKSIPQHNLPRPLLKRPMLLAMPYGKTLNCMFAHCQHTCKPLAPCQHGAPLWAQALAWPVGQLQSRTGIILGEPFESLLFLLIALASATALILFGAILGGVGL